MYHLYILKCEDGSLYTGIAIDVGRRFKEHASGAGSRYVKARKPKEIVYLEKFSSKSDALKREAEVKSWRRSKKLNLIYGRIR